MTIAIETENLGKSFGLTQAVSQISLKIEAGELFGLLGPNGSGKTTTIRMLTGLLPPTQGKISVMDRSHTPDSIAYRRQIGVAFTGSLYARLSAQDNLSFFRSLYPDQDTHDPQDVLRLVDLQVSPKKKVREFSLGMRKRLDLARALLNKPRFLFLDEPTLGLDPLGARKIRKVIRSVADEGVTVFLTTHYMEEADALCDRVGFINQGQLIAVDLPWRLKSTYGRQGWQMLTQDQDALRSQCLEADQLQPIQEAMESGTLYQLRKGEASLEDVFLQLTGKELDS